MTDEQRAARLFQTWLESEAPERAPAGLVDQITTATRSARPRPTWIARLEGHHMDVIQGGRRSSVPRLGLALAIIGLILAVAGAIAFAGSRQPDTVRPQASLAAAGPSSSFVWPKYRTVQPGDPLPADVVGTWVDPAGNEYAYYLPPGDPHCLTIWRTQQGCLMWFAESMGGWQQNADIVTLVGGKLRYFGIGRSDCKDQASLVSYERVDDRLTLTVDPHQCYSGFAPLVLAGAGGVATAPPLPTPIP